MDRICEICLKRITLKPRRRPFKYHPGKCQQEALKRLFATARYRRLHAKAARAYQVRHAKAGLCLKCPKPATRGIHCDPCGEKDRARRRKGQIERLRRRVAELEKGLSSDG
jgi:hypothetical protein